MLAPPPDLPPLPASLGVVEYLPLGWGAHHWRADAGFVTVDDLDAKPWLGTTRDTAFAGLSRAYATARALALDFVVAPGPLSRLSDRYALSVAPWVDGVAGAFLDPPVDGVRDLLARLHATPADAPISSLALPSRATLDRALREVDEPWPGAEEARAALAARRDVVAEWLAEYDALAARPRPALVVTHGEPHPGNVLTTADGLRLVDWDTVALAEPERDLWHVGDDGDPHWLAFYRLRWRLEDVGSFVAALREGRGGAEDLAFLRANLS